MQRWLFSLGDEAAIGVEAPLEARFGNRNKFHRYFTELSEQIFYCNKFHFVAINFYCNEIFSLPTDAIKSVAIDYCNKNFVAIVCCNKRFLLSLKILYCNKKYCYYKLLQKNFFATIIFVAKVSVQKGLITFGNLGDIW